MDVLLVLTRAAQENAGSVLIVLSLLDVLGVFHAFDPAESVRALLVVLLPPPSLPPPPLFVLAAAAAAPPPLSPSPPLLVVAAAPVALAAAVQQAASPSFAREAASCPAVWRARCLHG